MSPSKGSIFCHGKYTRTWHLQKLICCRNITTIQRKYWQKNQHATETLPTIQSSLGPGLAVGGKGKKTGSNRKNIGEWSERRGILGGMGGGAWSHAFDAAVQWYQILVSSSDWSNVFVLTYSRCCWRHRSLSKSRSYNSGKYFLNTDFEQAIQISMRDLSLISRLSSILGSNLTPLVPSLAFRMPSLNWYA